MKSRKRQGVTMKRYFLFYLWITIQGTFCTTAPAVNFEKFRSPNTKHVAIIGTGYVGLISGAGLVSLTGGKWTTYRKIGEDVINRIEKTSGWPKTNSVTNKLKIHGSGKSFDANNPSSWYGSDMDHINRIIDESPDMGKYISEKLYIFGAQVILAIRNEMARTVEDVLARRTRALQLDASESIRISPAVAELMAKELGLDRKWQELQIEQYAILAKGYLLN